MEETENEEDKDESGFSLGSFLRNRFLLRTIFGRGDEDEESASVIQVNPDTGVSREEEETPEAENAGDLAEDTSEENAKPPVPI